MSGISGPALSYLESKLDEIISFNPRPENELQEDDYIAPEVLDELDLLTLLNIFFRMNQQGLRGRNSPGLRRGREAKS